MIHAAIAMNRFGLGARPTGTAPVNPADWLKSQIRSYEPAFPAMASQPSRAEIAAGFREYQIDRKDVRAARKDAAAAMAAKKQAAEPQFRPKTPTEAPLPCGLFLLLGLGVQAFPPVGQ